MKLPHTQERNRGFTLVELMVVFAVIAIVVLLLLPAFTDRHPRPLLAVCMQHLKQIGLVNALWNQDYTNGFPPLVSTNNSGTREYLLKGRVDLHFQALAPYLGSQPHILWCPADKRKWADDFTALSNSNISYFVSLDSTPSNSVPVAAGDCNFEINEHAAHSGVAIWTTSNTTAWAPARHSVGNNAVGNFLFSDGHVERVPQYQLPKLTQQLGTNTNRLAFP